MWVWVARRGEGPVDRGLGWRVLLETHTHTHTHTDELKMKRERERGRERGGKNDRPTDRNRGRKT